MPIKTIYVVLICAALVFSESSFAQEFNWETLMLTSSKMQDNFDYKAHVDEYMQLFRPEIWKKYQNDEFKLHNKRQETIKTMREQIQSFQLKPLSINTVFAFGKYNFDEKFFPVEALSPRSYYSAKEPVAGAFGSSYPEYYYVFFTNTEMIGNLKMKEAEAERLLDERKNSSGSINRRVYAVLSFEINGFKSSPDKLDAKLTGVKLFSDSRHTHQLAQF